MNEGSSILIVDDEAAFLESTAELLRRDGYRCDCAKDTNQAIAKLERNSYDLLISDIKMPGNQDLRIVREAQQISDGVPVILVTAYPSVETAMSAVELPVAAYVTKPVDHERLRAHVETSIARSRGYRKVSQVRRLLEECVKDLRETEQQRTSIRQGEATITRDLLPTTIRTLSQCLATLVELETKTTSREPDIKLCEILGCPQWRTHRGAIMKTIEVLKETRKRFQSKELGKLRVALESLFDNETDL